ncbi:MAG: hypothetical protein G01um10148_426 [Parcubacteria group bacterium Gr01-1014_8]|nr:MAG: hypothetical protein G01um10148_426 [Parcubacteria group bacterium Gr01-1014_8]
MSDQGDIKVEKQPSRWEVITGSGKDQEDVREIEAGVVGLDPKEEELPVLTPESGMILRRDTQPIGVIFGM